jgi:hypothetical protein
MPVQTCGTTVYSKAVPDMPVPCSSLQLLLDTQANKVNTEAYAALPGPQRTYPTIDR